jgi:hypothetical protein
LATFADRGCHVVSVSDPNGRILGFLNRSIHQILEKKLEYNETDHQLFIDFKKAYDSVRREVLYNILI